MIKTETVWSWADQAYVTRLADTEACLASHGKTYGESLRKFAELLDGLDDEGVLSVYERNFRPHSHICKQCHNGWSCKNPLCRRDAGTLCAICAARDEVETTNRSKFVKSLQEVKNVQA